VINILLINQLTRPRPSNILDKSTPVVVGAAE